LFSLLLFSYLYVHQDYFGGTSTSRLDLLHALVVETFKIDRYHQNTSDKALFEGHYYSDKAPGTVLLALPGFLLAHGMDPRRDEIHPMQSWRSGGWLEKSWLATASSAGLITALGGLFFFRWLCRYVDQKTALLSTLAVFLGAAPFPYATMLFSHALVAGLVVISLWLIERANDGAPPGHARVYALAGCCAGLALASEFTAGITFHSNLPKGADGSAVLKPGTPNAGARFESAFQIRLKADCRLNVSTGRDSSKAGANFASSVQRSIDLLGEEPDQSAF
jgi:hypothetical protein